MESHASTGWGGNSPIKDSMSHHRGHRPHDFDVLDASRSFGGSPRSFTSSPQHDGLDSFQTPAGQMAAETLAGVDTLASLPRHGAPLSALEQIGSELMGIGMMSPLDTKSKLFRVAIQLNTQGELWPASKFVARMSRLRDMRAFSLTQREVGKILRMAYDDVVNQRWGLDAKQVRTNRDNTELFYTTKPVEARRLLKLRDMQDAATRPEEDSKVVVKKSRRQIDNEIDMSFAADRVGKEVGRMEHIANVLLMMIAAEKRERHGLLNNVQQVGQMLESNKSGVEKVQEKMEALHITQAEDRRAYQEQVQILTQEHEAAVRITNMKEGLRHLRMTLNMRCRRIVTRAWLFFREFVDEKVRNTAVGKAMCQNIIGKRLLIGKRKMEVGFYRWRKMVQVIVTEEHRQYVQGAVRQYGVRTLALVVRGVFHRKMSRAFRTWATVTSMKGKAYKRPRCLWSAMRLAAGSKRRVLVGHAFTLWQRRVRTIVACGNRVYHLLGKTYRGRLEFGFHRLRLYALNGAYGSEKQREATRIMFRCCEVAIKREKAQYFRKLVEQQAAYRKYIEAAKVAGRGFFRCARVHYSLALERWRFNLRQAARQRKMVSDRSSRMAKAAMMIKCSNQRAAWHTWKLAHARFRRIRSIMVRIVRLKTAKAIVHWRNTVLSKKIATRGSQIGLDLFRFIFSKGLVRIYYRAISRWRAVLLRDKALLKQAHSTLRTNSKDYHRRLTGMAWQRWRRLMLDDRLLNSMTRGGARIVFDSLVSAHHRRLGYRFTEWAKEAAKYTLRRTNQRLGAKLIFTWTATVYRHFKSRCMKRACRWWQARIAKKKTIIRQVRRCLVVKRSSQKIKLKATWGRWQEYLVEAVADEKDYVKTLRLFDNVLVTLAWRKASQRFKKWKNKMIAARGRKRRTPIVRHVVKEPPREEAPAATPREEAPAATEPRPDVHVRQSQVDHDKEERADIANGGSRHTADHTADNAKRPALSVDVASVGSPRHRVSSNSTPRVESPITSVAYAEKQRRQRSTSALFGGSRGDNPIARLKGDMDALMRSVGLPPESGLSSGSNTAAAQEEAQLRRGGGNDAAAAAAADDDDDDADQGVEGDERKAPEDRVLSPNAPRMRREHEKPFAGAHSREATRQTSVDDEEVLQDSPTRSGIIRRASLESEEDIVQATLRRRREAAAQGADLNRPLSRPLPRSRSKSPHNRRGGESPALRRMRRARAIGVLY